MPDLKVRPTYGPSPFGGLADQSALRYGQPRARPHARKYAAVFERWRPDRQPRDCRYAQLEVTTPYELAKVFGAGQPRR